VVRIYNEILDTKKKRRELEKLDEGK
jgi:hypothetical protein